MPVSDWFKEVLLEGQVTQMSSTKECCRELSWRHLELMGHQSRPAQGASSHLGTSIHRRKFSVSRHSILADECFTDLKYIPYEHEIPNQLIIYFSRPTPTSKRLARESCRQLMSLASPCAAYAAESYTDVEATSGYVSRANFMRVKTCDTWRFDTDVAGTERNARTYDSRRRRCEKSDLLLGTLDSSLSGETEIKNSLERTQRPGQ
ncbi:hypothetical protein DFH07DRAFT_1018806 [Mycena maculata]|uniref:Uncharacterized protein n=1 Tax=Mycena maculata TaxID=230809 RepID=A0AAD7NJ27_9AGAR|nr:hypothetical protein DFH07DRAFT_1018806 [Mycena maculata]